MPIFADGKNNDAGYILSFHRDLTEWFSDGYVWVVDRGFRDVFDVFEGLGIETKMPTFLKKAYLSIVWNKPTNHQSQKQDGLRKHIMAELKK